MILNILTSGPVKEVKPGDAGLDIYVPKLTTEIIKILKERGFTVNETLKPYSFATKISYNGKVVAKYFDNFKTGENYYEVYGKFTLPVDFRFCMPEGIWLSLDNRSSNFLQNITMNMGYIDNGYISNISIQMYPIEKSIWNILDKWGISKAPVKFDVSARIGQVVAHTLHQIEPVNHTQIEFKKLCVEKENIRLDGFGSTGK